jgi:hypothetical protein
MLEAIMRRFFFQSAVLTLALVFLSMSFVSAGETKDINWDKFSKSLVKSLKSDNEGVRLSAMQLVIKYGDKVNVADARYEVMDTFMNSKNQKVRQLALVTLYKINNVFDMGLLELQMPFEEDTVILNQIAAVLIANNKIPAPEGYTPGASIIASTTAP